MTPTPPALRTSHFLAFDTALRAAVPPLSELTFDGDVPLQPDGSVMRGSYLVLHDMGFDAQDDDRLTIEQTAAADGTYRVVVRVVALTRAAVRDVADQVTVGMVGLRLTVAGRSCGAIAKDPGPDSIQRDTDVSPPLLFLDVDFIWRSQRA